MTPLARAAFEQQRLSTQYTLYARPIKINSVTGVGCYNAPRIQTQLRDGGMMLDIDAILRVKKADWPTYKSKKQWDGKIIELHLGGEFVKFKIADILDSHLGSEWKITLESYH